MDHLLAYAEEELNLLNQYQRQYAERYPAQAADLGLAGDGAGDPHVRMLMQAVAVLNGRIRKKLADDLPEVTASFLEICAPHLLRPFPSCSIARIGVEGSATDTSINIPRNTVLKSPERAADGVICQFRTAYPVNLDSTKIVSARFASLIKPPADTRVPHEATGEIAVEIERGVGTSSASDEKPRKLRIFLDGEPSFCAALFDALFLHTCKAYVEDSSGRWHALNQSPISLVGLLPDEALLPAEARSLSAYRLLSEYFCYPAKFNFIDLDLTLLESVARSKAGVLTLHFLLTGVQPDSPSARLLRSLSSQHLLTGCTPIVNLFKKPASPIRVTYQTSDYPLIPDALRANAYEIYSVDTVRMIQNAFSNDSIIEFRPYYSIRHGENPRSKGHYWVLRQNEGIAAISPGYHNVISFVDVDFDPMAVSSATVSADLTCSNGRLPHDMAYSDSGNSLVVDASVGANHIRMLRRPSLPLSRPSARAAQWKLASYLALNINSLTSGGLNAFREMLMLHDFSGSDVSRRQIEGVMDLQTLPTRAWLSDPYGGTSVSGIEVRLTLEEAAFAGSSIYLFTQVLDRVLGLLVHLNSFIKLTVVSKETGKELLRCAPRTGQLNLL